MTSLKKQNIKTVMKYTWLFYIVSAVLVAILLNLIFGIVHQLPAYKTLTLFITGEVTNSGNSSAGGCPFGYFTKRSKKSRGESNQAYR